PYGISKWFVYSFFFDGYQPFLSRRSGINLPSGDTAEPRGRHGDTRVDLVEVGCRIRRTAARRNVDIYIVICLLIRTLRSYTATVINQAHVAAVTIGKCCCSIDCILPAGDDIERPQLDEVNVNIKIRSVVSTSHTADKCPLTDFRVFYNQRHLL